MTRSVMLSFFQNITGANFNKSTKKRLKNSSSLDEIKQNGNGNSSPFAVDEHKKGPRHNSLVPQSR